MQGRDAAQAALIQILRKLKRQQRTISKAWEPWTKKLKDLRLENSTNKLQQRKQTQQGRRRTSNLRKRRRWRRRWKFTEK